MMPRAAGSIPLPPRPASDRRGDPLRHLRLVGLAEDELYIDHVAVDERVPLLDDVVVGDFPRPVTPAIRVVPGPMSTSAEMRDDDIRCTVAGVSHAAHEVALLLVVGIDVDAQRWDERSLVSYLQNLHLHCGSPLSCGTLAVPQCSRLATAWLEPSTPLNRLRRAGE